MNRVSNLTDIERHPYPNLIRFFNVAVVRLPLDHTCRKFQIEDSAPRITFGKIAESGGNRTLPVSIHVYHALVDGSHVAEFVERLQERFDHPGPANG
jgi:chloramphenicol O-acetyltransferase type A